MSAPGTLEEIESKLASGIKNFSYAKLPSYNFSGKNLKNAEFRKASLAGADFSHCDLTFANFEGANLYAANFTKARCHRTNFKDANLANSIMEPTDLFGATFTLECKSFMGMQVLPGYYWGWIMYALLMKLSGDQSDDAREKVIAAMGTERYTCLREQYVNRNL